MSHATKHENRDDPANPPPFGWSVWPVGEPRVWSAGLMRLAYILLTEADEANGDWAYYQLLNSQTLVACRRHGVGYQYRIAKPDRHDVDRWTREVAAMETFLGITGWEKESDAKAKGLAIIYSGRN